MKKTQHSREDTSIKRVRGLRNSRPIVLLGGLDKGQANREVPYGVFMEERKRIELIAFEAAEARREYARHCRLLEALAKVAGAEHPGNSLGLPDVLPAELREFAAKQQEDRSAYAARRWRIRERIAGRFGAKPAT